MRDESPRAAMLVAVIVASVLMHVVLWPVGDQVLGWAWKGGLPPTQSVTSMMEVSLLDPADEDETPEPDEPDRPEVPPGKLVQLDRVTDERPPERVTPNVSEFDNRAATPTRAPNVHPQPGAPAATPGTEGANGKAETAPDPAEPQALPLLPGATDSPEPGADDDPLDADALGELTKPGRAPPPALLGSPGTRKALRDAIGRPGSHDDIDDAEQDDETSVDSKRWKYASFFNRVRNSISQHWHPEVVHAANDPDGRRFGTKTRRTRLIISLNPDGSLNRVRLDNESGVDYLDEEAIHAVRTGAPFANPPPGLVDPSTGLIEFGFGFIFEFGGSNRIFRYQR